MKRKRVLIVLLAALLLLAGCDGSMDEPQEPSFSDPSGGEQTGVPGSITGFNQLYSEQNALKYGVLIHSQANYGQNIKPEYMVAYEVEYNDINNSYYEKKWALDDQREAGTITVEEYYEQLYKLDDERNVARAELQAKWESQNVWTPCSVIVGIENLSDKDRLFQYALCDGNAWIDEGEYYFSDPVTLPANSNEIYTFKINTGGKYLSSLWIGCYVY